MWATFPLNPCTCVTYQWIWQFNLTRSIDDNRHFISSLIETLFVIQVLDLAANIFKQIPENIDYDNTAKILSVDPSPLNVVLLQEVSDTWQYWFT